MSGNCTFIRLLADGDKGAMLVDSIDALQKGKASSALFSIEPEKFSMVPGSPFAYWVSDRIRRLFIDLPPFEGDGRTVRVGLQTSDDFRFVRAWWEVDPSRIVSGTAESAPDEFRAQTYAGKKWVPFAKGGEYSPYYADIHLVVNWGKDGEEIRDFPKAFVRNEDFYFYPGLTWTHRTTSNFSIRNLPSGCIFGHKGPSVFTQTYDEIFLLLSVMQSSIFQEMIDLSVGAADAAARSYDIGIVQKLPIPFYCSKIHNELQDIIIQAIDLKRNLSKMDELSKYFIVSLKSDIKGHSISNIFQIWANGINNSEKTLNSMMIQIDDIVYSSYNFPQKYQDKINIEAQSAIGKVEVSVQFFSVRIVSYFTGAVFGRWDIRYATGEKQPPELPDPFAPLPACSPGMLQGEDGLPLAPHEVPADYPLAVDADGILVDDEGHPDDIVARIRDVLTIIWGDRADAIEKEACEILGVKSLRDYFRKPGAGGFWDDHVKRYSKSRRKAPIYWLLQSAKKNYAIWIYYPRMDADTLYKALRYAKDKLAVEERRLEDMQGELAQLGTGGPAVKRLEKGIDTQEAFISELHDFVEKLERAANLNLVPEHDDGVVLTIAPLWELVPWKEPKNYWDELIEGKYEWSSIGKQLAEKGMRRS